MGAVMQLLRTNFLPGFLAGILVNFEIAAVALGLGLALGSLLGLVRFRSRIAGALAGSLIAVMRAAPSFVIIFFLLNVLPRRDSLSGVLVVALALVPYAAAYIADSTLDALHQFRSGSALASLLVLPNIARAFFVLVMSSSVGAAIGVHEGIAVVLRQAESMPSFGSTLLLFAIGVVCFAVPLQAGFFLVRLVQHRLGLRSQPEAMSGPDVPEDAASFERGVSRL